MSKPNLTVVSKDEIFHRAIFRWFKVRFKYTRFDGNDSGIVEHLVIDRGDSVSVLLHDAVSDEVILAEQLRIATIDSGTGWLFEVPAGRIDPGEQPIDAAKREAREETGAEPDEVRHVSSFFLSPGGCSERIHLYYCPFKNGLNVSATGGLADENEDIKVHRLPLQKTLEMIKTGEIVDAKTIVGIQWLTMERTLQS